MKETRKNFVLKLLAYFKREVEEKLISDRINDSEMRENVLSWSNDPLDLRPAFVEIYLPKIETPLVIISFERFDEMIQEFDIVEDLERQNSNQYQKVFDSSSMQTILPKNPLVCRSLLTSKDIQMRVSDKSSQEIKNMIQQQYKHKTDSLAFITLYQKPNLPDLLKNYACNKLKADVGATIIPEPNQEKDQCESIDLLLSLTDSSNLSKKIDISMYHSSMSTLNLLKSHSVKLDQSKLINKITSASSTIKSVQEIDSFMLRSDEYTVEDISKCMNDFIEAYQEEEDYFKPITNELYSILIIGDTSISNK